MILVPSGLIAAVSTVILALTPALPARVTEGRPAPRHYAAVALGTLGGASTTAFSINERAQAVGQSQTGDGFLHPFLWQCGRMSDLGVLQSGPEELGIARDINAHGQVVGGSRDADGSMRAVLWQHGRIVELGDLGGGSSFATAINDRGQIVGTSWSATGEPRGFIWQHGRMGDLGIAGPTEPLDISNRGDVVGWSGRGVESQQYALRWHRGKVTWLSTPGRQSRANAVNDRGQVVGSVGVDAGETVNHAVRWYRGSRTELGILPGGNASGARAINNHGDILGSSNLAPYSVEEHPVLYRHGAVIDLTTAGLPDSAAYSISDINDRGQILAGDTLYSPARPVSR